MNSIQNLKESERQLSILVVEDSKFLQDLLGELLTPHGFKTRGVSNGAEAIEYLTLQPCDIVLSDIRMPRIDGLALLEWCHKYQPEIKVILMTGFSEIMETKKAYELGAIHFLLKPFKENEVVDAIEKAIKQISSEAAKNSASKIKNSNEEKEIDYCRLSIEDFIAGSNIPFNIYIKIGSKKFVKIARSGEEIDINRLRSYRAKSITHLYLNQSDFQRYISQCNKITNKLVNAKTITPEKKAKFLSHVTDVIMHDLFIKDINSESFNAARKFVTAASEVVSDSETIVNLLTMLDQHTDYLFAHSLGVALYGVMICHQLGWNSYPTTNTVMLCGLFHDIGYKEIDPEILKMNRILLNHEQRGLIESHCTRGAEILSLSPELPAEVIQVVSQHHEECSGQGYPMRLRKDQISPLSRLILVADVFCKCVIKNPERPEAMSVDQAIRWMDENKKYALDPNFFDALKEAVL